MKNMEMRDIISNEHHLQNGVYFAEGHTQFNYNDGDSAEDYIFDAIKNSRDISSSSRELEAYIRDWPSRYHLSRARTHAYASMAISNSTTVLEVGSGCGSITRLLGERAGNVIALEGSSRRAQITRERTRDLSNVAVLCSTFELISFKIKFDVIICNGVLEYASMFITGARPVERMIDMLSKLLSDGGSLVVAIENKFGLRYFSSCAEEHTSTMYDGIEGYARWPAGPKTFGKCELKNLLNPHFSSVDFLIPLPDYKLPVAVIHESLIKKAECAELFANVGEGAPGARVKALFHERLAWHEIMANGLLVEFANSYIAIGSNAPTSLLASGWLGEIYAIKRVRGLEVRTRISNEFGDLSVEKTYLSEYRAPIDAKVLTHHIGSSDWIDGVSIHTLILRAVLRKDCLKLEERLGSTFLLWWDSVLSFGSAGEGNLSGSVIDFNWKNAIVSDGSVHFIDKEWMFTEFVSPSWLIYRAASYFVEDEIDYVHRWSGDCRYMTKLSLIRALCDIAKIDFSSRILWRSITLEMNFQKLIMGRSRQRVRVFAEALVPIAVLAAYKNIKFRFSGRMDRLCCKLRRIVSRT